jgi:flagellar basal body-associated protein FliL
MLKKVIRIAGIVCSVLFLAASLGIIFWITQDEQERLALRERAGFADSQEDILTKEAEEKAKAEVRSGIEAADKTLSDIDRLLSTLSTDDLPIED